MEKCCKPEIDHFNQRNKPVLDYVLSQTNGNECPYVKVSIYGIEVNGLLDSGANSIFLGQSGIQIIKSLSLKIMPCKMKCTVANNEKIDCVGLVNIPITLKNKIHVFEVFLVPKLKHTLVLGTLFWIKMSFVPDLRKGEWYFSDQNENLNLNMIQTADDLTLSQRIQLDTVVNEYFDSINNIKLGYTEIVEHKIITNSPPIKSRYYPVSKFMQDKIDAEVSKMLDLKVIEKSNSGWSSPVVMIPKPDGTYRFCVDYRKLNQVTEKCAYPLPYMSSILDKLGQARYLSSLDIASAYWQIKMESSSRQYTAFTIPGRGLFQFTRMPFGLTNAPATFQSLVDTIFGPELEPYLFKYLDDLIIVTTDFETHLRVIKEVFRRLKHSGLTLNKDKCKFCREELKYLGHIVNRAGINVDPEKVSAVVNMPTPKTPKQIRRLLGMVSWYRRFIPNMSTMVAPLTALTKKNVKFKWSPECENALNNVKNTLISAPILSCPNFDYPFTLQTDSSSFGIGAVLSQEYNGKEHVIAYISRALTKNEVKYSVTEKECISIIWACEKFRCYLESATPFTVITDHHSLLWLHNLKNPNGRLARWVLRLQGFNYNIVHRPGKHHHVPDCLSRAIPSENNNPNSEEIEFNIIDLKFDGSDDNWYLKMCQKVRNNPLDYPLWRVSDDNILFKHVNDNSFIEEIDKWKYVVPKSKRKEILYICHNNASSGHLGIFKTYSRVISKYYWPKLRADVKTYVSKCKTCQEQKPEQRLKAGEMGSKPNITQCWQYISTDIIGPLVTSTKQNKYILTVVDYFSKFTLFFPMRNSNTKTIIRLLEENVFLTFGVPEILKTDNGVQFKSKDFSIFLKNYGVKLFTNPLYHPEANFSERYNRVIKTMISSFIEDNQKLWDKNLSKLACALRTSKSEVTGGTPYFVNFGTEMILDGNEYHQGRNKSLAIGDSIRHNTSNTKSEKMKEIQNFVKNKLEKSHLKAKHEYNLRHRPIQYSPGDFVWKKEYSLSDASKNFSAKLAKKFTGPYKIIKKLGINVYELQDKNGRSKGNWHIKDLKLDSTLEPHEKW